jgi:uncharacterized membrane protein YgcG
MLIYILIAAAMIALVGVIWLYNLLVRKWQMVNNGWADIDVQLKRRSDLVPRLVEAVSGYAAHERNLFEEGFRLYMETAEKLQLNAVEVGSAKLPPMSKQRYEAFLPYAVALGVEKPWTRHFERLLPAEAEAYNPGWAGFSTGGGRSLSGLNDSLISSMSSGVSSALPQSSGSSGSGGGGSSGGGGGGGGGGGW